MSNGAIDRLNVQKTVDKIAKNETFHVKRIGGDMFMSCEGCENREYKAKFFALKAKYDALLNDYEMLEAQFEVLKTTAARVAALRKKASLLIGEQD